MTEEIRPLEVSVIVTQHSGRPIIELRKSVYDLDLLKAILSCAFHERPFLVLPKFSNKLKSLSSLIDKGILYKEGDNYFFTI